MDIEFTNSLKTFHVYFLSSVVGFSLELVLAVVDDCDESPVVVQGVADQALGR